MVIFLDYVHNNLVLTSFNQFCIKNKMKIAFYSVVLNHHQVFLADELYQMFGDNYFFIETVNCCDFKGATADYSNRPYLIRSWESVDKYKIAMEIALTAEVCVFAGNEALPFQKERLKMNLLSFDMGERILKRGLLNLFSPRISYKLLTYHINKWHKKPLYKLCCSAYAANDFYLMLAYRNRCFKWGYFTGVDENLDLEELNNRKPSGCISFMWCARFLSLKHPELPVKLAKRLKEKGYVFRIDMYGSGVEFERTQQLVKKLQVEDVVTLCGNLPNDQILQKMREHEIFLFTSDKNEGWGAVANEAMSNGCVILGSDSIGSIPFLVKDGENGSIYKSCDLDSLTTKAELLLNDSELRNRMSIKGYETIRDIWSSKNATRNLIQLIDDIRQGREPSIKDGPCSRAMPL